jgi:hypothetical protein
MLYAVNTGQVISEIIDGEAVMINLTTGNYYSLNESGAAAWTAIEAGASVGDLVELLSARYEGDRAEIQSAVERLIDELTREELIVGSEGNGSPPPSLDPVAKPVPFQPPTLEKHTDMQDLILLDPVHEVGEQGWPHVKVDGGETPAPDRVTE